MQPVGLVAPDEETETALRDALALGLSAHGRVAVVEPGAPSVERPQGAATAYRLDGDAWTASGGPAGVREVLSRILEPDLRTRVTEWATSALGRATKSAK